jgi:hypothetical protein
VIATARVEVRSGCIDDIRILGILGYLSSVENENDSFDHRSCFLRKPLLVIPENVYLNTELSVLLEENSAVDDECDRHVCRLEVLGDDTVDDEPRRYRLHDLHIAVWIRLKQEKIGDGLLL